MNIFLPILAAIFQAGSFTLDKIILSIRNVSFKTYTGISSPLIFLITFMIFIIFRPPISLELFSGNFGWLIVASIGLIIIANLIFYRTLDNDKLGEIQTIQLLDNIPIIILSSLIFADERKFSIMIPVLIAAFAIIWSHWERGKFKMAKFTVPFLAWSIIAAPARALFFKILLIAWNPISLGLVRSGVVVLILAPLFFKDVEKISLKAGILFVATNILTSVAWILYYFSYQKSGIIFTILLFSLQPLLVYFASVILLKERFRWKKATAFAIVLASIIAPQILGK